MAALRHWQFFVTGGFITGALWVLQGVGWIAPPHWTYWTVASLGVLISVYRAWLDEHKRVEDLTKQLDTKTAERKRELIRGLAALRALQGKVAFWREIANGKWGMAPDLEKFLPSELPTILYEAERIKPDLRATLEIVENKVTRAESLITQFLSQPAAYRQEQLMRQVYNLLDESAPALSNVITELEAFEKALQ